MSEWTVVGVIIALVTFIIALAKPMISLNTTLTKLTVQVERLEVSIRDNAEKSDHSFDKLWAHNDAQDKTLADHESRINMIENRE